MKTLLSVQEVLYQKLTSHVDLTSKVVGIYDYVQLGQKMPYVCLGEITSTEYGGKVLKGEEVLQTLHVYSDARGKKETSGIIYEISRALETGLIIPNYDCHQCRVESVEIINVDQEYYQGKIQIKLKITEVL